MLGRSAGIDDQKLQHVGDDPLPEGVFSADEAAIVRYAQASTLMRPITDAIYADLSRHFDRQQIMEIWAVVSLSNQVNRFHATFLTDLDDVRLAEIGPTCPLPLPPQPSGRP